jgi:peptidoglycan/LPS O-acetylase OafA/YrhL
LLWPVLLLFLRGRAAMLATIAGIAAWPLLRLLRRGFLASGVGAIALSKAGMDTLLFGALLALLVHDGGLRGGLRRLARHPAGLCLPAILLGVLYTRAGKWPPSLTFLLPLLRNTALVCLVWWCVSNPTHAVGRLLQSRPLVIVGRMSYSLYLW